MSDVKILVKPNGPLLVSGDINLVDGAGRERSSARTSRRAKRRPERQSLRERPEEVEFLSRQVQTVDGITTAVQRRPRRARAGLRAFPGLQRVERGSRGVAERQQAERRRRGEAPRLPVLGDVAGRT